MLTTPEGEKALPMTVLLIIHIFITLAMIGVILMQRSEGGGLGMGGGASGSMFSARGAANLLTRVTAVLAALFMGNCLLMGIISKHYIKESTSILAPVSEPMQKTK
jgi:preprotein translocase subunit SecG